MAPHPDHHDRFVRLFLEAQPQLYAYIRTLTPHRTDAEEILQEVAAVLWRKFDTFEPGTHFDRWAYRTAYHQVLYHRRKQARDRLVFSESVMQRLADDLADTPETVDQTHDALLTCLGKLGGEDRDLVRRRYRPGATGRSTARALGRSESAVSRALNRIYAALLQCIDHTLGSETSGGRA